MLLTKTQSTILLVDDNSTNLQLLLHTLSPLGHRLLATKSGKMALQIAKDSQPDLILLDILMPEMDGFEVLRQLKKDADICDIPIIFLSALNDTQDKVKGLELGAVDYIIKPFHPSEVVARVNSQLTISQLKQSLLEKNEALALINQQMHDDLNAAAKVQQSFLPENNHPHYGIEFSWHFHPSKYLAGDALNYFAVDDHRVAVYVLDVSGHGVAASLLSVAITRVLNQIKGASSLLYDSKPQDPDGVATLAAPHIVAKRLNELFPMAETGQHFFTLLYGIIDSNSKCFDYVTCGHPGPVIIHSDGSYSNKQTPALPIGIIDNPDYRSQQIELKGQDRLILYSDGITEHKNLQRQQFGEQQMINQLLATYNDPLATSTSKLIDALMNWGEGQPCGDDVSILAVQMP